jgi:hypothetical protein
MTNRSTSADFVTAFATGWPEEEPDVIQDFALTPEQALLIAKTMKQTAARLTVPKGVGAKRS